MSRFRKPRGRVAPAPAAPDWMTILRLDKKGFDILSDRVDLKFKTQYPDHHSIQRLVLTLRYLVTGEGYTPERAEMFLDTYNEIFFALKKTMEWPTSRTEWEDIAGGFQSKWHVPNCLGAMVLQRFKVEVPKEFQWMFATESGDMEFSLGTAVDAHYRVFFGGNTFIGICPDEQLLQMIEQRKAGFPNAKASAGGSAMKGPFTFVGCEAYKPRSWLRVESSARDEDENQVIRQGLRPGEIAFEIMMKRFGVLQTTIPVLRPEAAICLTRTIAVLHNYFLITNPRYAAEYKNVDQLREAMVTIPRCALDEDKDWMDQMHMDREAFQCLLHLAMSHFTRLPVGVAAPLRLRVALRYMATGKGYDPTLDLMLTMTFKAIDLALKDYQKEFPLPEAKWLEMATNFQAEMSLPNCAGVLISRLVMIGDKSDPFKTGCIAMVLDATGRIAGSGIVAKDLNGDAMDLHDGFLRTTAFRLPQGEKKLMFIGAHDCKPHPLLATPANPGHFTREQIEGGVKLGNVVDKLFADRFNVLGVDSVQGPRNIKMVNQRDGSSQARKGASLLVCKMHNFLKDKSATY